MQEAGADASYVEGPRSIEELKEIGKRQKVHSTECGHIAAYELRCHMGDIVIQLMVLHAKACILDALVTTCLVVSFMLCCIGTGLPTDRPISKIHAFVGPPPCDQLLVQMRLANIQHNKWFQNVVREQGLKACSMIYGSTTPLQSLTELSDMGYHMVFRPLSGKQPACYLSLQALATHLSVP